MTFTTLTETLARAITIAERTSGKSLQLPIVSYLLFEIKKNKLQISSTNLEQSLRYTILGKSDKEGSIAIPARMCAQILNSVTEEKIELNIYEETLRFKTDVFNASLRGLDASDFPVIPKIENGFSVELSSALLAQAFSAVLPAVSQSDIRPELQGVAFMADSNGGLKFAATDSFRLAEKKISASDVTMHTELPNDFRCIIPVHAIQEIIRLAAESSGSVRIKMNQNQIGFYWEEVEYTSRLLEGNFPVYEGLIPSNFMTNVTINRKKVIDILKQAGLFASKLRDVRLEVKVKSGTMHFMSRDSSKGEYEGTLVVVSANGEDIAISFNYQFLLDALASTLSQEIFMGISAANKPILIKGTEDPSYIHIVMPIKA